MFKFAYLVAYHRNHAMELNDTHHTRLGGLMQDFQVFQSKFNGLLTNLKKETSSKFETVNERLNHVFKLSI